MTAGYLAAHGNDPRVLKEGLVHGFTHGFATAAVILAVAAVVIGASMNTPRPDRSESPA